MWYCQTVWNKNIFPTLMGNKRGCMLRVCWKVFNYISLYYLKVKSGSSPLYGLCLSIVHTHLFFKSYQAGSLPLRNSLVFSCMPLKGKMRFPIPLHHNRKERQDTHTHIKKTKKKTNRCQRGASWVLSEEDLSTQRDIHWSAKYLWSAGTDPRV